jgi:ribose/xylose/arabinose/galactoside ABC-type transport system permease subunit
VFLGSTAIRPGSYNVVGTLLGVYFVGTAVSGLSLMGVQTWVQSVFNGAALILAVAVAAYLARARRIRDARSATRSISPPLRASSPSDPEPKAPRS